MDEVLLFPTVIHQHDLKGHKDFARLADLALHMEYERVRLLAATTYPNRQGWPGGILGHPDLGDLRRDLEQAVDLWARTVGCRPLYINHSWLNRYDQGDRVERHRHEHSIVSAALFIHTPLGSCSLRVHSPIEQLRMFELSTHTTFYNENFHEFTAEPGRLIIFPSWLAHDSLDNQGVGRTTLSFNTQYQA
jgi:uncharacterized protein (TIGR02466 family)